MTSFGIALPAFVGSGHFRTPGLTELDARLCLDVAVEADELGFDSIWAPDHLMIGQDDAVLEGWTLLSAVAAVTRRARLGLIQQSTLFRSPGVSAKAFATLDAIAPGRVFQFAGPGTKPENDAFGLADGLDEDARFARMIEAAGLMRELWLGDAVEHDGAGYRLSGARSRPATSIPLWFASLRPDVLEAFAPIAAGWCTPPVSVEEAARRIRLVKDAVTSAGRSPSDLEYALETQILVTRDADAVSAIPAELAEKWLVGSPETVAARIEEYRAAGVTHFILWFMDLPSRGGIRLFRSEVAGVCADTERVLGRGPSALE
jgi:alkanesulfonate monooxygenase SsuD/methylene tetrahydromethanopterin reductase-like flavin-dependent oxidoreductase (luciferase family)